jgi:hypothetical protein
MKPTFQIRSVINGKGVIVIFMIRNYLAPPPILPKLKMQFSFLYYYYYYYLVLGMQKHWMSNGDIVILM